MRTVSQATTTTNLRCNKTVQDKKLTQNQQINAQVPWLGHLLLQHFQHHFQHELVCRIFEIIYNFMCCRICFYRFLRADFGYLDNQPLSYVLAFFEETNEIIYMWSKIKSIIPLWQYLQDTRESGPKSHSNEEAYQNLWRLVFSALETGVNAHD